MNLSQYTSQIISFSSINNACNKDLYMYNDIVSIPYNVLAVSSVMPPEKSHAQFLGRIFISTNDAACWTRGG